MLSFKLASTSALSLILVVIISSKVEDRFAYSSEFSVVEENKNYQGKGKVEVYFHDDNFETNTLFEETVHDGDNVFGEIKTKGKILKKGDGYYYLDIGRQSVNISKFERFHNYSDFPILQNLISSERRLPRKNPLKVIKSSDNYIVVASYRNGGQVLALKKY